MTKNDIFIPEDLWNASLNCRMSTSFEPSYVATTTGASTPDDMFIVPSKTGIKKTKQSSRQYPRKIYIKGLCGRNFNHVSADNNRRKELAVTVSHLMAIRQAVYSTTATSRYALILEDDVWTPFDIRLEQLAEEVRKETGSAFGIIQFLNSKRASLDEMFYCFQRQHLHHCKVYYKTSRWAPRPPADRGRSLLTWSTGAYLIDRVVMKPVIGNSPPPFIYPRPCTPHPRHGFSFIPFHLPPLFARFALLPCSLHTPLFTLRPTSPFTRLPLTT